MNRQDSVLYRTRQAWKFWLMPAGTAAAIILLLGAGWAKNNRADLWALVLLLLAVCAGIAAFVFPSLSIKCPNCGVHWFWAAIFKQRSNNWFDWLFQPKCPSCKYSGGRFDQMCD